MKFVLDAQLPRRLAARLSALGYDALHTTDLPGGNRTADEEICRLADSIDAAVVTKDADFAISRTLRGVPRRLLVLATGNIGNDQLLRLMEANLSTIVAASPPTLTSS